MPYIFSSHTAQFAFRQKKTLASLVNLPITALVYQSPAVFPICVIELALDLL